MFGYVGCMTAGDEHAGLSHTEWEGQTTSTRACVLACNVGGYQYAGTQVCTARLIYGAIR